jgi:hypothetical protein
MLDFYPEQIVRAGVGDVWKRSPVSLETCWVPLYWSEHSWDVDYILEQALRWHVSSVNIKSSSIPPQWRQNFEAFQKRMGYRLILRRLEYPRSIRRGQMMPVHMWWLNAGVAPVYRDYALAVRFYSPQASESVRLPVDIRKWLPGDAVYDGSVYIPKMLSPVIYRIRVAVLEPRTGQPAIKLGIEGLEPDGWYDLGALSVE